MRVRILQSAPAGAAEHQYLTSYLVDDEVAIDAGCLGLHSLSPQVERVKHVFLTHAHIDHVGTLPLFLESAIDPGGTPALVYGSSVTLDTIRRNVFNGQVWVESDMLAAGGLPVVQLRVLEPEVPVEVNGLRITAVPVNHAVPTFGYLIDDGSSAVAFGADSGPTERIWEVAGATGRLRAVFLECSFPDRLGALASKTGHLTPSLWSREVEKLPPGTLAIAIHIKPRYRERVIAELKALGNDGVQVGAQGREYRW